MTYHRFFGLLLLFVALTTEAQPPARLRENEAQSTNNDSPRKSNTKAQGSIREFPTAQAMPEDVVWRRDIYRRIDLTKDANAPLYYPITPNKEKANLFVQLFRLIMRKQIKAYEYTRDMNEHFDESHAVSGKKLLDENRIFYETVDGKMRLNDADLPSEEVRAYFLKESVYYNQHTATFSTRVTALCPVVVRGTAEFGEDERQQIPLFWVNYDEAAPHLAKISLMSSNLNNASLISADDYFATKCYEGEIYKTTNLQDRIIAQYAPNDSARIKEQGRIEGELKEFEQQLWKGKTPIATETTEPTNNTAEAEEATPTRTRTNRRTARRNVSTNTETKPKQEKVKASSPKSSSSRSFSVRRQRR